MEKKTRNIKGAKQAEVVKCLECKAEEESGFLSIKVLMRSFQEDSSR